MKKQNWLALILIGVSVAALMGYRMWDRITTDTVSPGITVEEGVLEVSVHDGREALLQGITAEDDRDGDVTANVIVENVSLLNDDGEASVQYAAFDRSGNVAKTSRTVRYTDYESPRFRLSQALMFQAGSTFDVESLVGAEDMLEGDISHRVRATALAEKTLTDVGLYDVQLRVTNAMGDTRELVVTVELYSGYDINATLELKEYLVYLSVGDRFEAKRYLDAFRDATGRVILSGSVPEGYQLSMDGTVDTGTPGVYEVRYTVNHTRGEQIYTGVSRLVVVVEE